MARCLCYRDPGQGEPESGAGPTNFGSGYRLLGNSVPLTAGKAIRTSTLPAAEPNHVFAITVQ
ncbi:hypothetical protein ACFU7T_04645 [Streptomyces sp. NPDC057555]|uniref:hypothetical protein n=1 Tax=Streptomyces sp. NPDC057555 TaxID=3346166 RepID=UPI0036B961AB